MLSVRFSGSITDNIVHLIHDLLLLFKNSIIIIIVLARENFISQQAVGNVKYSEEGGKKMKRLYLRNDCDCI